MFLTLVIEINKTQTQLTKATHGQLSLGCFSQIKIFSCDGAVILVVQGDWESATESRAGVRLVPVIGKNFDRGPIFALISGPILPDHWTENVCFDLFLCENVRSHNRKRAFRSFSL